MNLKRIAWYGRKSLSVGHAQTWHDWLGYTQTWKCMLHLPWWLNMKNWFQGFPDRCLETICDSIVFSCANNDWRWAGKCWRCSNWIIHRSIVRQIGYRNERRTKTSLGPTEMTKHLLSDAQTSSHTRNSIDEWKFTVICSICVQWPSSLLSLFLRKLISFEREISKTINPNNDEHKLTINYSLKKGSRGQ